MIHVPYSAMILSLVLEKNWKLVGKEIIDSNKNFIFEFKADTDKAMVSEQLLFEFFLPTL